MSDPVGVEGDHSLVLAATDASAHMAAAAASMFFPPEVALPLAGVATALPHLRDALGRMMRRRVEAIHEGLQVGGVSLEQLIEEIGRSEEKMDLWRQALRAGLETRWQLKCRALGLALAYGTLGERGFDKDRRIIAGLEAVEEWDLRVLAFIDELPERRENDRMETTIKGAPGTAHF